MLSGPKHQFGNPLVLENENKEMIQQNALVSRIRDGEFGFQIVGFVTFAAL